MIFVTDIVAANRSMLRRTGRGLDDVLFDEGVGCEKDGGGAHEGEDAGCDRGRAPSSQQSGVEGRIPEAKASVSGGGFVFGVKPGPISEVTATTMRGASASR